MVVDRSGGPAVPLSESGVSLEKRFTFYDQGPVTVDCALSFSRLFRLAACIEPSCCVRSVALNNVVTVPLMLESC
jgi:hypothetical protein